MDLTPLLPLPSGPHDSHQRQALWYYVGRAALGFTEGFGLLIWCRIYNLRAMFQRADLGCMCWKGNEVKLGEDSASKEASPVLRAGM